MLMLVYKKLEKSLRHRYDYFLWWYFFKSLVWCIVVLLFFFLVIKKQCFLVKILIKVIVVVILFYTNQCWGSFHYYYLLFGLCFCSIFCLIKDGCVVFITFVGLGLVCKIIIFSLFLFKIHLATVWEFIYYIFLLVFNCLLKSCIIKQL